MSRAIVRSEIRLPLNSHWQSLCLVRVFMGAPREVTRSGWAGRENDAQAHYAVAKHYYWSSESSGIYCRVLNLMSTDVSEVRATSIIRAIAVRTSETSVDIQLRTRQYIPEDSQLHTRCRENFKSHSNTVTVSLTQTHFKSPTSCVCTCK
jgi:hypothetical protein